MRGDIWQFNPSRILQMLLLLFFFLKKETFRFQLEIVVDTLLSKTVTSTYHFLVSGNLGEKEGNLRGSIDWKPGILRDKCLSNNNKKKNCINLQSIHVTLATGYVLSIEHLDCYRFDSWKLPLEVKQSSLIKLTNTGQTVTFNFVALIA